MASKLNHLAITTDHYTLLGMFYRAMFGLKASGDTARELSAISVGDGYVGMTVIPRRVGRKAGLDHFGIEVDDLEDCRIRCEKRYPDIEFVKRPGNRPFTSFGCHDPAGNYFDLGQKRDGNRAEVYAMDGWKQENTFSHFAMRVREAGRMAEFYHEIFGIEVLNSRTDEGGYQLTDGRIKMLILPWKISSFNGAGIEQPGMDHFGFKVPSIEKLKAHIASVVQQNIALTPKPIDFDSEGAARLALLQKCPHGAWQLGDPDGTPIDIEEY